MSGHVSGKVWGRTKSVAITPFCELHHINIDAGGTCSIHLHQYKTNGFYVLKGKLKIKVWQKSYDLIDETILGPGDYMEVGPNLKHQFEALEDVEALELYFPTPIGNDIVRDSVGSKPTSGTKAVYTKQYESESEK